MVSHAVEVLKLNREALYSKIEDVENVLEEALEQQQELEIQISIARAQLEILAEQALDVNMTIAKLTAPVENAVDESAEAHASYVENHPGEFYKEESEDPDHQLELWELTHNAPVHPGDTVLGVPQHPNRSMANKEFTVATVVHKHGMYSDRLGEWYITTVEAEFTDEDDSYPYTSWVEFLEVL